VSGSEIEEKRNTSSVRYCLFDATDEIRNAIKEVEDQRKATDKHKGAF
jgi:hypothetical protein